MFSCEERRSAKKVKTLSKCNKRFDIYTLSLNANCRESGAIAKTIEWDYELPNQDKNENILIHGVNSKGNALIITFKRIIQNDGKHFLKSNLCYKNGKEIYNTELTDIVTKRNSDSFQLKGLTLQVLSPFRLWRITFRGILLKNCGNANDEPYFVKLNCLWFPLSKIFDFKSDHNASFIGNQLKCDEITNDLFEDRYEQYGQLKGTIEFEGENDLRKIFLWGNKCKSFQRRQTNSNSTITRILGYSKDGLGFHIGCVNNLKNNRKYQYGHIYATRQCVHPLFESSLNVDEICDEKFKVQECKLISKGPRLLEVKFGEHFELFKNVSLIRLKINDVNGACIKINDESDSKIDAFRDDSFKIHLTRNIDCCVGLVLQIRGQQLNDTCGDKGLSLMQLSIISKQISENEEIPKFTVPNGIVVTTNAYRLFLNENSEVVKSIEKLKQRVWVENDADLRSECESVISMIVESHLCQRIKDEIEVQLRDIYGDDADLVKFAIRSSASGEDCEEMSAAGQMNSYLGVKGFENIFKSVLKCWASQFNQTAVEYKHGYGQLLNTSMAVIIQEMVNCDISGVLFTCNPVNGDPRKVMITANYGLCESVVSASVEPDTITVFVNPLTDEVIEIESLEIGSKKSAIKLTEPDEEGTIEIELKSKDSEKCCIEEDAVKLLTKLSLFIKKCYGNERDIEWGISNGYIYLLQSRPVTNLDAFTEFELLHEMDSAQVTEKHALSRANLGEVVPGALSHLGLSFNTAADMVYSTYRYLKYGLTMDEYCPYFATDVAFVYNQYFFDLNSMIFESDDNAKNKGTFMAIFGHDVENVDFAKPKDERVNPALKRLDELKATFGFLSESFTSGPRIRNSVRKIGDLKLCNQHQKFETAAELFNYITNSIPFMYEVGLRHAECTNASIAATTGIMELLTQKDAENENLLHDFSILLSENKGVISAEIPKQLKAIAEWIEDDENFLSMSESEAVNYLEKGDSEASFLFNKFIDEHGHRGYKECDFYIQQWCQKPNSIINSLKSLIQGKEKFIEKEKTSNEEKIAKLKTKLTNRQKWMLRNILLPRSMKAVGYREQAKSLFIYIINEYRKAFWKLAEMMVHEGRIPSKELLFFLKLEEIDRLVVKRDATLVMRSKQRIKIWPKMDSFQFDEIIKGPDYEPIKKEMITFDSSKCDKINGTTVCLGKAEGRAIVAKSFDDVVDIKPGDILITYSTDVGWTPYFPILAGIVTEIGGLISHGAVIAREYGLPCLIGATNATQMFTTGDQVILDTENSVLIKVN